ncbi:MAG: DUF2007 domain-containing protein [Myxococcota bacterium]|jgi:hypothetical protein|nr:DUF2007 domain-containing protein [Myxococcota bacterium]
MEEQDRFVELVRVFDTVEADLIAAFLEDDGLEFQLERSARSLGPLMPGAESPTIIKVYAEDLDRARTLLEEYGRLQQRVDVPSGFPEEGAELGSKDEEN